MADFYKDEPHWMDKFISDAGKEKEDRKSYLLPEKDNVPEPDIETPVAEEAETHSGYARAYLSEEAKDLVSPVSGRSFQEMSDEAIALGGEEELQSLLDRFGYGTVARGVGTEEAVEEVPTTNKPRTGARGTRGSTTVQEVQESQEELSESDKEIQDRLTGQTFKLGFGDYTLDTGVQMGDDTAAFLVTTGAMLQDTYRGVNQMLGLDEEEWKEETRFVNELFTSDEYFVPAIAGTAVGAIADPAAIVLGAGAFKLGSALNKVHSINNVVKASRATKIANTAKASKTAAAAKTAITTGLAGGTWAGLGYVDEESGETRIGNTAIGFVGGNILGAAGSVIGQKIATSKASKALAREFMEEDMAAKSMDTFRHEVARIVKLSGLNETEASFLLAEHNPELALAAKKAKLEYGYNYNIKQAVEDFDVVEEAMSGLYTMDASPALTARRQAGAKASAADKAFGLISTRVANISERAGGALRTYEANLAVRPEKLMTRRAGFADLFPSATGRKIHNRNVAQFSTQQVKDLNKLLITGNFGEARKFIKGLRGDNALKQFEESVKVLDELGDELVELGILDKKIENYWPKIVKKDQREKFLKAIGKVKDSEEWENQLGEANKKLIASRGSPMSPAEEATWFDNKFLRDKNAYSFFGHRISRSEKAKNVEDLMEYYVDPITAFDSYVHKSIQEAEKARFLGAGATDRARAAYNAGIKGAGEVEGLFNITAASKDSPLMDGLDEIEKKVLAGLIKVRFNDAMKPTGEGTKIYKGLVNTMLLANPRSAVKQLGDLAVDMYRFGTWRTLKGVLKTVSRQGDISLEDVGLTWTRFAEMEDISEGWFGKRTTNALQLSGFTAVDRLGKETFLNAALDEAVSLAKKGKGYKYTDWSNRLKKRYGNDGFETLEMELQNWKKGDLPSDNVLSYALGELADFQPIFKSEHPELYYNMPYGKTLYTLKTFMLKQVDIQRRDIWNKWRYAETKADKLKAVENAARYYSLMGSTNLGAAWVGNKLILGDPEDDPFEGMTELDELIVAKHLFMAVGSEALNPFGINYFTVDTLFNRGLEHALATFIPPFPAVPETATFIKDTITQPRPQSKINAEFIDGVKRYAPIVGRNLEAGYFPFYGYTEQGRGIKRPSVDRADDNIGRD